MEKPYNIEKNSDIQRLKKDVESKVLDNNTVKCPGCGNPLPIRPGFVKCSRCNADVRTSFIKRNK